MSTFAEKYPEWKDFPNGLRVLVVDKDNRLLDDLKTKLEAFSYVVTAFASSGDALAALRSESSDFHVALVEATTGDDLDGWKVLEAATHLPVIMMSSTENLAMMMKGIASGASEFLQKPLSDETLKNIWQHVVRKALCAGGELKLPNFVQAVEDPEQPLIRSQAEATPVQIDPLVTVKTEPLTDELRPTGILVAAKVEPLTDDVGPAADLFNIHEDHNSSLFDMKPDLAEDCFLSCQRSPAPGTPQLEQTGRLTSVTDDASDESPRSNEFVCLKTEINNSCDDFSDYDGFLEVKSEMDDLSDVSSDLCGFLDATTMDDAVEADDYRHLKSKFCADLQFDEELELDADDIAFSGEFVVDGEILSGIDLGPSIMDGLGGAREGLEMSMDCLDDAEVEESREFVDEEALLLEEVKKAEKSLAIDNKNRSGENSKLQHGLAINTDNNQGWTEEELEDGAKKSESSGKGSKNNTAQGSKRKMKVDWTAELHRRFVQAVEQLGVDKAIPSKILEIMGVRCLTRHNIASHLQKYRSHKKHLLVREAEATNWKHRRHLDAAAASWPPGNISSSSSRTRRDVPLPSPSWLPPHHPAAAAGLTPIQPHPTAPIAQHPFHVWGHPTLDHSHLHLWHKPPLVAAAAAAWRAPTAFWPQQPCIDAWGHPAPAPGTPCYPQPIMRLPLAPIPGLTNMAVPVVRGESFFEGGDAVDCAAENGKMPSFHLPKETVDAAINEVLSNPCTPLPLGLKPPSLESVISELQRQGISSRSSL